MAAVAVGGAGRWTVSWLTAQAVAMPTTAIATIGRLFSGNSLCREVSDRNVRRLHGDCHSLDLPIGTPGCLPI